VDRLDDRAQQTGAQDLLEGVRAQVRPGVQRRHGRVIGTSGAALEPFG
jgi:hypothetical protein